MLNDLIFQAQLCYKWMQIYDIASFTRLQPVFNGSTAAPGAVVPSLKLLLSISWQLP